MGDGFMRSFNALRFKAIRTLRRGGVALPLPPVSQVSVQKLNEESGKG